MKNPIFGNLIMACILLNTVVLAADHVNIENNDGLMSTLDLINTILTFVFLGEMLLNIAGLGVKDYFSDSFNCFDATIVIFSLIDFFMGMNAKPGEGGGGAVSALRGARLLRILKMAKEWATMQTLLKLIAKTVMEIGNFGVLLMLFIFIYSLCGMQFFSNRMRFDDNDAPIDISNYEEWLNAPNHPRSHFDDILWSMVTVFQILTGENWNACMYDGWRCSTIPELAVLFYLSLVIFGAFIVMNLFLAILLSNFEGNDDLVGGDKPATVEFHADLTIEDMVIVTGVGKLWKRRATEKAEGSFTDVKKVEPAPSGTPEASASAPAAEESSEESPSIQSIPTKSLFIFDNTNPLRLSCAKLAQHKWFDQIILVCILVSSLGLALDNPLSNRDSSFNTVLGLMDLLFSIIFIIELVIKVIALGFIGHEGAYLRDPWNGLDSSIVLISILSMADAVDGGALKALRTLRVLRPLRMIKRFPELQLVVNALVSSVPGAINVMVVSCLFLLLFAILGVNLFKGTFSSCDLEGGFAETLGDRYTPALQDFINQYPEYNLTTYELFNTATDGSYADLFKGPEANDVCTDVLAPPPKNWKYPADKLTSRHVCECLYGADAWEAVTPQNFDNVGLAFNLLFEITTTEGWVDVMYAAVDNLGQDMNHRRDEQLGNIAYFILFMLIGAFFVMELFVGVVIDNFNTLREDKGGGNIFMTEEQEEWAKTQAFIMKIKPEKKVHAPKGAFNLWCYNFVMPGINPFFDQFIMGCIIGNSVVMSLQHHGQSMFVEGFIETMNYIFALIFTIECVLKLFAMGTKYFRDSWNKFDFIVVLGTNAGILMFVITGSGVGPVASIVRMFRIGRLVRLINSAKSLRKLFNTLITSLPSMANIGFLLFILFFIFSVMGVQSYGKIHLGAGAGDLSEHANFHSMPESFILLFRFSTGENWNGFMHSLMSDLEGCEADHDKLQFDNSAKNGLNFCVGEADYSCSADKRAANDGQCCKPINGCGSGAAIPPVLFFYMFTLMVSFVMFNLFVGVVLSAFDDSEEGDILSPDDLDKFVGTWGEFDPDATWFIKVEELKKFVDDLEAPMGFGKEYHASDQELLTVMWETGLWEIPYVTDQGGDHKDQPVVHITHVASALAKRLVKEKQGDSFKDLHSSHPVSKKVTSSTRSIERTVGDIFLAEAKEARTKQRTLGAMGMGDLLVKKSSDNSGGEKKVEPVVEEKKEETEGAAAEEKKVEAVVEEEKEEAEGATEEEKKEITGAE